MCTIIRSANEVFLQVKRSPEGSNAGSKLGLRAKLGGASREKSSSPKRSPKLGRAGSELKDYGMIDSDGSNGAPQRHYPPHAYSRLGTSQAFRTLFKLCPKVEFWCESEAHQHIQFLSAQWISGSVIRLSIFQSPL